MLKDEQDDGPVLPETSVNKSAGKKAYVWATPTDLPAKATAWFNVDEVLLVCQALSSSQMRLFVCVCVSLPAFSRLFTISYGTAMPILAHTHQVWRSMKLVIKTPCCLNVALLHYF